ncbi:MAG: O-antigen ligase family protein [Ruminococcus sp.]|nr:O-antigen ligase family protein [Ruminococcus sp.]
MKKLIIHLPSISALVLGLIVFGCVFSNALLDAMIPSISTLQLLGRIAMIASLLFWCILMKKKLSRTTIILTVMLGWIMLSTFSGGWNMIGAVSKLSSMYLICLTLDTVSGSQRDLLTILDVWKFIILMLVVIDILTQLAYPNGMYSTALYSLNWFLGYKTERIVYSFPMIMMFAVTSIKKYSSISISFYIVTALAALNAFLSQAGAGTAMFLLIFVLVFIIDLNSKKKNIIKKIMNFFMNYYVVLIVYAIAVMCLVILQNLEFVSEISESMGKGDGLSGRDEIWTACLEVFKESPVRGVGYMSSIDYVELVGMAAASNSHNMVLTILVSGGIVALGLYLVIFINAFRRKDIVMAHHYIIAVFIYAMMILGVTSSTIVFSIFGMLGFWLMENLKNEPVSVKYVRKIRFEFF